MLLIFVLNIHHVFRHRNMEGKLIKNEKLGGGISATVYAVRCNTYASCANIIAKYPEIKAELSHSHRPRPLSPNERAINAASIATNRDGGSQYALKIFDQEGADADYKNEVEIYELIEEHPNLLTPVDSIDDVLGLFENDDEEHAGFPAIRFPRMGGSVLDCEYSINEARYVIREMFKGIAALHSRDIVHADVKPDNLLWGYDGSVKLGDFGLAGREGIYRTYSVGTIEYNSPEALLGLAYGREADIWSAFTTAYYVIKGTDLFENVDDEIGSGDDESDDEACESDCTDDAASDNEESDSTYRNADLDEDVDAEYEVLLKIETGIERLPAYMREVGRIHYNANGNLKYHPAPVRDPSLLSGIKKDAASFIRWGLRTDPRDRPTADQVLAHPWLSNIPDNIDIVIRD